MTVNAAAWFEIPVHDLDRARTFYETIMQIQMNVQDMGIRQNATFPYDPTKEGAMSGSLVKQEGFTPVSGGTLVYINAGPDLAPVLARVEGAGGKVIMPKTDLGGPNGHIALFIDPEGNTVGLHSYA